MKPPASLNPGKRPHCNRCHTDTFALTMSYFNTDDICLTCKAEERMCPNFQRAYDAETDAVRAKNYAFPGIGLTAEDLVVLANARKQRMGGGRE